MYDGEKKCIEDFGGGNLWERECLEDLAADVEVISEWILKEISWEGIDWIVLARERDMR